VLDLLHRVQFATHAKGKVERCFYTVQEGFESTLTLPGNGAQGLEELNQKLTHWIQTVYHLRPHSSTGVSPQVRFAQAAHAWGAHGVAFNDPPKSELFRTASLERATTLLTQDEAGMLRLFRQFSTPGGIPSHVSAPTPGSIHEGGELGYVLVHAFGAAFDNPDLIVAAVVGDGEAETGPLEGSWKGTKFLNPVRDGAVLPILHLNGYKISGPTVWGREPDETIESFLTGHGYEPFFVSGEDPARVHREFAVTLEKAFAMVIDSMATQHAKWLEHSERIPWRQPVPSFNYLLTSTCWRNDHNGFSHQGPGFIDNLVNKKPSVVRIYLPPDANCLLSVAAAWLLRRYLPQLKVRVVNVVDLMCLCPAERHPHGMSQERFISLFTANKPVIFAFHGYPAVVYGLLHGRPDAGRFHARGYLEEGTTTTPFDMVVLNKMSRIHLAMDAIRHAPNLVNAAELLAKGEDLLVKHRAYVNEHFDDLPEIRDWVWSD
jgi:phosphoketolase